MIFLLVKHIENGKLCFLDMKIMPRMNGGNLVNNESFLYIINLPVMVSMKKKKKIHIDGKYCKVIH